MHVAQGNVKCLELGYRVETEDGSAYHRAADGSSTIVVHTVGE